MHRTLAHPRTPPIVVERARALRAFPTLSEAKLWQALRGNQLGVTFRRQVPVGRYIADFAAPAVRLVVEVDGGYHARRARPDARRDRALERAGWRVLRLEAELVVQRLPEAVARVRAAVETKLRSQPRTPPVRRRATAWQSLRRYAPPRARPFARNRAFIR